MTGLDIFMIVLGLGLVIISYILSEQFTKKNKRGTQDVQDGMELTNKQLAEVQEKLNELLEEKVEEAIVKADNSLAKICNEKIMAISEFSDQVIEKINQNHSEVVFLYNMLNEKDSEMKKLVQQLSKVNVKLEEDLVNHTYQNTNIQDKANAFNHNGDNDSNLKAKKISSENMQKEALIKAHMLTKESNEISNDRETNQNKDSVSSQVRDNNHETILNLYEEGKTVLEISKALGLGQGEVKLVINLFQSQKGESK